MKIALGQMTVGRDWRQNLETVRSMAQETAAAGGRLLLAPEGIIARDPGDNDLTQAEAQPLDGPFTTGLLEISAETGVAVAGTVHVPEPSGRARNVFVVADGGRMIAEYHKLHLYDAFTAKESDRVSPGDAVPPVVTIDGIAFGLMTCYDVRFPELARAHALAGADALLLPAAWVRGSLKEQHWQTLVTARALENTVYVAATGETSARNIGRSMIVDPFGVTVAAAGEQPALVVAEIDRDRIQTARGTMPVLANTRFAPPVLTT